MELACHGCHLGLPGVPVFNRTVRYFGSLSDIKIVVILDNTYTVQSTIGSVLYCFIVVMCHAESLVKSLFS